MIILQNIIIPFRLWYLTQGRTYVLLIFHQNGSQIMKITTNTKGKSLLLHPVEIDDSDQLEEGDDEQWRSADVAAEDLQPVVPRAQGEQQAHQEGDQANTSFES